MKGCNIVWNTGKTEMLESELREYIAKTHKGREIDFLECRIDGKIIK